MPTETAVLKTNKQIHDEGKEQYSKILSSLQLLEHLKRNQIFRNSILGPITDMMPESLKSMSFRGNILEPLKSISFKDSILPPIKSIYNKFFTDSNTNIEQNDRHIIPNIIINNSYIALSIMVVFGWLLGHIQAIVSTSLMALSYSALGIVVKNDYESKAAIFPEIDAQRAYLEKFLPMDAVFLHGQKEYWGKAKSLKTVQDITEVNNDNIAAKKLAEIKQKIINFINPHIMHGKELFQKEISPVQEGMETTRNIIFAAIQTLSGTIFTVSVTMLIVFAAIGLTGPFLLFAFVPALSVGIIATLAMVAAKLSFAEDTTAAKLVDWAIWLVYLPIDALVNAVDFALKPCYLTWDMLQEKRYKKGFATIGFAVTLAVVLGVVCPLAIPAAVGAIGVAATATLAALAGAYIGLTCGVIAVKAYDKGQNSMRAKLRRAGKQLFKFEHKHDTDAFTAATAKFKQDFPLFAVELLQSLEDKAANINRHINALKQLSVVDAAQIDSIAKETLELEECWDTLIIAINKYNDSNSADDKQSLLDAVLSVTKSIASSEIEQFEIKALERKAIEDHPTVLLFNDSPSGRSLDKERRLLESLQGVNYRVSCQI